MIRDTQQPTTIEIQTSRSYVCDGCGATADATVAQATLHPDTGAYVATAFAPPHGWNHLRLLNGVEAALCGQCTAAGVLGARKARAEAEADGRDDGGVLSVPDVIDVIDVEVRATDDSGAPEGDVEGARAEGAHADGTADSATNGTNGKKRHKGNGKRKRDEAPPAALVEMVVMAEPTEGPSTALAPPDGVDTSVVES